MLDPANGLRRTRMVYLITKALISGVIIMAASEAAKPNLRGASCFSTTDFDFSHDLAMARHRGQ